MDMVEVACAFLAGGVAGAGIAFAWLQRRLAGQAAERAAHAAEARAAALRAHELISERDAARTQLSRLEVEHAQAFATLEAERRAGTEQLKVLQATQDKLDARMRETFSALATQTLETSGRQMLELARAELKGVTETARVDLDARQKAIETSMKPVNETLEKVGQSLERSRIESAQLFTQVKSLGHETSNLVKALRTPNVRGRWGEQTLRRVVEMAQMVNHCDFVEQKTIDGGDGKLRPDLIVRMPGGRNVVVDAKAPLDRYLAMVEAPDDATRAALLKAHSAQVREHVTQLSSRQYWEAVSPAPELVIMFLPSEPLMSSAVQDDPNLIEYGVNRKVVIASPLTLIVLLRAVSYGWRQERLHKNAEEIRALGQELYTRVRHMAEHFHDLGRQLSTAVGSYNRTVGSFEGRVLAGARRFVELSAASEANLPGLEPIEVAPRLVTSDELKTRPVRPSRPSLTESDGPAFDPPEPKKPKVDLVQGDLLAKV
ncbi:MAG: DNA recombination protein RmuC [Archangiaceae bacterium]|nr:DNA recombination protein RmuC [Archangiaceae bacterium]